MRVLIDTNILADLLLGRDPYYDIANNILLCVQIKEFMDILQLILFQIFFIFCGNL